MLNEFKDSSGRISVSVWRRESETSQSLFNNFEVDVGEEWVCVGGGGTGSESPGHLLTASYPYGDWKGWRISSKDHVTPSPTIITAYAIGMKIEGLTRDELKNNLSLDSFLSDSNSHNSQGVLVKDEYLLLGGGFQVTMQPPGKGNLGVASFLGSSIEWRARSKDMEIVSPSPIRVYAVGIKPTLTKLDPSDPKNPITVGRVDVTFDSTESVPSKDHPVSTAKVLTDYALCGGGAVAHCNYWSDGSYLWSLEPVTEETQDPEKQTFTGKSKDHIRSDPSTITAYAMGIKFHEVGS
jgi:hypothetical protein